MAGDWIKWTKGLSRRREVLAIASELGIHRAHAAGLCMEFWEWLDDNVSPPQIDKTTGDACVTLKSSPLSFIDSLIAHDGFARALENAGWLSSRKGKMLVPNYCRHNSQTAKSRALTAERMAAMRSKKRDDSIVTKSSPEKRREEKSKEATNVASSLEQIPERTPAEFTFPLAGGKLWPLTERKLGEYQATYSHLFDLPRELRKARQWLMDNVSRRPKASRGIQSFLTRWLNRACDEVRKTIPGSRVAAVPSEDAVFNAETGEFVKPFKVEP